MVELAERRFSARTDREREQQELVRLGEVEGFIQKRASQFSMDDPMLAEDLAQQAREAVIKRLREYPDCPYSHLVNKARDAIFRYRQKGKSVDGLLYQRGRARHYDIISLEKPIDTEAGPLEEKASLREVYCSVTSALVSVRGHREPPLLADPFETKLVRDLAHGLAYSTNIVNARLWSRDHNV